MAPWVPVWKLLGYFLYLALYGVACEAIYDHPKANVKTVVFKSLPLLHLIFIILSTDIPSKEYHKYKNSIILGLLVSMVADGCLVWRSTLFLPGLLLLTLTHLCYINAIGTTPFGGGPTFVSCLIVAGSLFGGVFPKVHASEGVVYAGLVAVHGLCLCVLVWRSIVCLQTWRSRGPLFACLGAIILGVSDFMMVLDKWQYPINRGSLIIGAAYFMAQMCMAISAACFTTRVPVKQD